jgi:hypothetical protein
MSLKPAKNCFHNFVLSTDNGYVIVITDYSITITVPAGLMAKIEVGFLQLGTGDVSLWLLEQKVIKLSTKKNSKIKPVGTKVLLITITLGGTKLSYVRIKVYFFHRPDSYILRKKCLTALCKRVSENK